MPLYLVRHAHAGSRRTWVGDDLDRPLSAEGSRQAEGLAALLADAPVGRVLSSPATRCQETVAPLARSHGLEVEVEPRLREGSSPSAAFELLLAERDHDAALCSHGDVIPKLLRKLTAAGMRADTGTVSHKGSVWVLDVADGAVVAGTYHPPTAFPSR